MFAGHALLAFALIVGLAAIRDWSRERTLQYAVLAAAFAAAPDVDIAYAPIGLALSDAGTPEGMARSFWATGNLVHRSVTHSLVTAVPVAAAAALWMRARRTADGASALGALRFTGPVAVAASPVAVAAAISGALGGAVTLAFCLACLAIAELAVRRTDVRPATAFGLALFGLASHPFGDLFTGEPPALLYPFGTTIVSERISLHADPTLNLLGAFGVELVTVWLAFAAVLWLVGVRPVVPLRASLATGYAASVVLIPAPTLELSYPFVFSVLAVGAIGVLPKVRVVDCGPDDSRFELPDRVHALTTALAAVTIAWIAYTAAYLAFA